MYRPYSISHLLQQGKQLRGLKARVLYRYKENPDAYDSKVYIVGYRPGYTGPQILTEGYPMPQSECGHDRIMSVMINLPEAPDVYDLEVVINKYENMANVYAIDLVNIIEEVNNGNEDNDGDWSCGLYITGLIINDGAIYTDDNNITVDIEYSGIPTHYRVSNNPYEVEEAEWIAFSSEFSYVLPYAGLHTLYVQLKNDEEESNVASASIGWSGVIGISIDDDFDSVLDIDTVFTETTEQGYYDEVEIDTEDDFDPELIISTDYTEDVTEPISIT